MESAAVLRSFHCTSGIASETRSALCRPSHLKSIFGNNLVSLRRQGGTPVLCVKASETKLTAKSDVSLNGAAPSEKDTQKAIGKKNLAVFPNGFQSLILEVCEETEIAELKLKVGSFEMHMKRNIDAGKTALPVYSPTIAPPIPSEPMTGSTPVSPPSPAAKSSTEIVSPFVNVFAEKSAKLSNLDATGASGYVVVSSPVVGSFRRGRTFKGKKQPPSCKEGDLIKEGQVIGYVDQFGTELPVKSGTAGEVLKVLFTDGEAVGYGDSLIAVLPSFHGIK
ncbi:uncharacterized protein LOC124926797 [Impatiens glandulifera]|uniref:uncharacterized protein LOC124926797 n=1 Tax=Impatiens glandulifera TaxID=253017 RepID=UPI001FB0C6A8|nr:uncharacterized protein LOC124926797 [Impatiens glandulifera]